MEFSSKILGKGSSKKVFETVNESSILEDKTTKS
jgi:hypothetical protein